MHTGIKRWKEDAPKREWATDVSEGTFSWRTVSCTAFASVHGISDQVKILLKKRKESPSVTLVRVSDERGRWSPPWAITGLKFQCVLQHIAILLVTFATVPVALKYYTPLACLLVDATLSLLPASAASTSSTCSVCTRNQSLLWRDCAFPVNIPYTEL